MAFHLWRFLILKFFLNFGRNSWKFFQKLFLQNWIDSKTIKDGCSLYWPYGTYLVSSLVPNMWPLRILDMFLFPNLVPILILLIPFFQLVSLFKILCNWLRWRFMKIFLKTSSVSEVQFFMIFEIVQISIFLWSEMHKELPRGCLKSYAASELPSLISSNNFFSFMWTSWVNAWLPPCEQTTEYKEQRRLANI